MKFNHYILAAFALLSIFSCKKEDIAGEWHDRTFAKYYGHVYNQKAADIVKTTDNGYLILGTSNSYGQIQNDTERKYSDKMYVIKTDSLGNEMWSKTFGDSSMSVSAKQILFDSTAGMYYLCGTAIKINTNLLTPTPQNQRMIYYTIDEAGADGGFKLIPNDFRPLTTDNIAYPSNSTTDLNKVHDFEFASAVLLENFIFLYGTTSVISNKNNSGINDISDICIFKTYKDPNNRSDITLAVAGGSYEDKAIKMVSFTNGRNGMATNQAACLFNIKDITGSDTQISYSIINFILPTNRNSPYTTNFSETEPWDLGILATDICVVPIPNGNKFIVLGVENTNPDLAYSKIGSGTIGEFLLSDDGIYQRTSNSMIKYTGAWQNAGPATKTAHVIPYGDNNGYLVTSTSIRANNINSDVQLIKFDNQFNIEWDVLHGTSGTMDVGVKAFPIDSTITDSPLRPIVGIGILGTFDFGASNTMIGFLKTNTKGELRPN